MTCSLNAKDMIYELIGVTFVRIRDLPCYSDNVYNCALFGCLLE